MSSKLNEIATQIKAIIEGNQNTDEIINITEGNQSIDKIINIISQNFGSQLSPNDFEELKSSIETVKEAKEICDSTYKSAFESRSGVDYSTDINKSRERLVHAEQMRDITINKLAVKIFATSYNGTLNMEVMKQLEENGYDATYGSESMRQMFLMYQENIRVKADNNQCRSELNNCYQRINQQHAQITDLTSKNQSLTSENNSLKQINDNLIKSNNSLGDRIKELTEQVSSLSSTIKLMPKLIVEQLSEIFRIKKHDTLTPEDTKKTL